MASAAEPSARARAIAEGLARTGRAAFVQEAEGHICLRAKAGGFYWVRFDGGRVLRGDELDDAEVLQSGFVDAMLRAGQGK